MNPKSLLISALSVILGSMSDANAYTIEECNVLSSDSVTIMRNFHDTVLDGHPGLSTEEVRRTLNSELLKNDDGLFWFVVEVGTGNYIDEFKSMPENEREINRAAIAVQIRAKCIDGVLERYSFN